MLNNQSSMNQTWHYFVKPIVQFFVAVAKKPLVVLALAYAIFWGLHFSELYFNPYFHSKIFRDELIDVAKLIAFFWFALNTLELGKIKLLHSNFVTRNRLLSIFLPVISNSLQIALFLLLINLIIPELNFTGFADLALQKSAKILLIIAFAWLFFQLVNVSEKLIINQYGDEDPTTITSRKIRTQILILKRIILSLAVVVTIASIFMVFDSVNNIGKGLLTTAGLISAVGAFASQQSLGRIFSGLQIAFTQPIRIGDTVIIDGEFGTIEEITLSYVVIKIWDLRRLILPTDYFTTKGLQNLTRDSSELLGTIFIYTDYTLPIDTVREKYFTLLAESKIWDKKVANLQITDIKENTMEIRCLVSASNASDLWNLRCEMREKLIKFIVEHHPECLSKSRVAGKMMLPNNFELNTSKNEV